MDAKTQKHKARDGAKMQGERRDGGEKKTHFWNEEGNKNEKMERI